jgi:hypothetical protein
MTMDFVDGTIMDLGTKRDAIVNAIDGFIARVKATHEHLIRIADEMQGQERLAAAERSRHKAEMDRGRAEENELHLRIKEARKELAETIKQNDHQRAVGRAMFDSICGEVA